MRSYSTLGLTRRQRQRQSVMRLVRYGAGVALLAGLGFVAYETGRAQNAAEIERLASTLTVTENELLEARSGALAAREQERAARERAVAIAERYSADVPSGERLELLQLMDRKLEGGVDVDRLRFVLTQVEARPACAEAVETKRVLLTTPVGVGPESSITFGDNRITVTGQGASARDAEGRAEAWFDVAEPVAIRFLELDGEVTLAEGVLPLSHRLVDGASEWRFQIRSHGERGFVEVSGQSCPYP